MSKGLTLTVIFQAQSLNYGEGISNIAELKKLTRMNGDVFTFASRQAIRYDIVRLGNEIFNWNLQVVDKGKGTVQFKDNCTIKDSQEMDLFGYMKTAKKDKETENKGGAAIRSAAVRLSNAISLEPYKSDMDFLTNKGMADRINEHPNIANSEQHNSFYSYTLTIDLDKIGVDGEIKLDNKVKAERITQLLDIMKILNRNIRGRQENLSPLFIVGGIYNIANPYFLGRTVLLNNRGKYDINTDILRDTLEMELMGEQVKNSTSAGIITGIFNNEEELKALFTQKSGSVEGFFKNIKEKVKEYYGVK
jgi:CRISPR-associated protein Cst2